MLLSVIIPVYNERATVLEILSRVLEADTSPFEKEVIVVDDGSTDGTGDLLDGMSMEGVARVIRLPVNSGKASAIRAALSVARGDVVLIQDADLEYSPSDYKRLLSPLASGGALAVYGSRFLKRRWPRGMKAWNWAANRLFTFLTNLLYGGRITDEGTAYKVFRRDLLDSVEICSSGFEFCPEVTAKLLKKGVRIAEVPVSYEARDRRRGKKPGFADGLKVLWTILKLRFVR